MQKAELDKLHSLIREKGRTLKELGHVREFGYGIDIHRSVLHLGIHTGTEAAASFDCSCPELNEQVLAFISESAGNGDDLPF